MSESDFHTIRGMILPWLVSQYLSVTSYICPKTKIINGFCYNLFGLAGLNEENSGLIGNDVS